jgi:hypothetical protein
MMISEHKQISSSCSICLDELKDISNIYRLTLCKHVFHDHCIQEWISKSNNNTCPNCRNIIRANELRTIRTLPCREINVHGLVFLRSWFLTTDRNNIFFSTLYTCVVLMIFLILLKMIEMFLIQPFKDTNPDIILTSCTIINRTTTYTPPLFCNNISRPCIDEVSYQTRITSLMDF